MLGVSRKRMIWLCGGLRTMLDAGLPVSRALNVLSGQAPSSWVGRAIQRIRVRLEGGATLAEAFEAEKRFPPLFIQLIAVGEEGGTLERTLGELVRFYEFQERIRRNLVKNLILPLTQYVIAVAVVSFATYIIGMIQDVPTNWRLWLVVGYGGPLALIAFYFLVLKPFGGTRLFHEVVLRVPVLGRMVRALALARFSLVMHLLSEAAVPVSRAVERSFEATNNGAFAARADRAVSVIKQGGTVSEALDATRLFPFDYMATVEIGEESGKLSERFDWLASHYAERAESALGALAVVVARLVWVCVAAIIIYFISKFFGMYLGGLQQVPM
ncbi:MAG: type II secretion system F family protein [Candidatus Brocadiae bacterium]|nr:type II secretion system F family protein [Candidatus Brocadiia bacterium]